MKAPFKKIALASSILASIALTACGGGGTSDSATPGTPPGGGTTIPSINMLKTAAFHWDGSVRDSGAVAMTFGMEVFDDETFLAYYIDPVNSPNGFGGVIVGRGELVTLSSTSQVLRSTSATEYAFRPTASVAQVKLNAELQVGVGANGIANLLGTYVRTAAGGTSTTRTMDMTSQTTERKETPVTLANLAGAYSGMLFDKDSQVSDPRQALVITTDGKVTGQYRTCGFTGQLAPVANRAVAKITLDFGSTCGALKTARGMVSNFNAVGGFSMVAAAEDGTGAFLMAYERP